MSAVEKRAALADRAAALGLVGRCSSCGELWPSCKCGTKKPAPLVEWVQWRSRSQLSRYHVRLSTGGFLLCGRVAGPTAAANSFPPTSERCRVCVSKLDSAGRPRAAS